MGRESKMKKTAKEYLKEPYSRVLVPESDGTYSADILEFPGCFAEGRTLDEAYANLEKVAESWIEAALEQGQEIPAPVEAHDFSGRIALRIPKSIHKQAAKFAEMDNTSLNQFFLTAVAARVGAEEFYERLTNKLKSHFAPATWASPNISIHVSTGKATGVFSVVAPMGVMTSHPIGCVPSIRPQITALSSRLIKEEVIDG
jgi:predicted RNase H-like HicB family nuclease